MCLTYTMELRYVTCSQVFKMLCAVELIACIGEMLTIQLCKLWFSVLLNICWIVSDIQITVLLCVLHTILCSLCYTIYCLCKVTVTRNFEIYQNQFPMKHVIKVWDSELFSLLQKFMLLPIFTICKDIVIISSHIYRNNL